MLPSSSVKASCYFLLPSFALSWLFSPFSFVRNWFCGRLIKGKNLLMSLIMPTVPKSAHTIMANFNYFTKHSIFLLLKNV